MDECPPVSWRYRAHQHQLLTEARYPVLPILKYMDIYGITKGYSALNNIQLVLLIQPFIRHIPAYDGAMPVRPAESGTHTPPDVLQKLPSRDNDAREMTHLHVLNP